MPPVRSRADSHMVIASPAASRAESRPTISGPSRSARSGPPWSTSLDIGQSYAVVPGRCECEQLTCDRAIVRRELDEYFEGKRHTFDLPVDVARLAGGAEPRDRLVPMPDPSLDKGNCIDDINVIRKTLFSLLEFRERPGEIALPEIAIVAKSKMSFRQIWVKRESMIGGILGCGQPRRACTTPRGEDTVV